MRVILEECAGQGKIYPNGCKTKEDVLNLYDSLPDSGIILYPRIKDAVKKNGTIKIDNELYFLYNDGNLATDSLMNITIANIDETKIWRIEEDYPHSIHYYKIGEHNKLEEIE